MNERTRKLADTMRAVGMSEHYISEFEKLNLDGHWESYPPCEDGCRITYPKDGHKLCCICKRIVFVWIEEDK